jgi:hypothetical protein
MIDRGDLGRRGAANGTAEHWLAERINDDPAILGLGGLDVARVSWRLGQVSLLMRSEAGSALYIVELQLGPTDDRHLIRVVERWAVERKRHSTSRCFAVLGAEQFPHRCLNVLQLIHTAIPLRAMKLHIAETVRDAALRFTPVVLG